MYQFLFSLLLAALSLVCNAQKVSIINQETTAGFRGLSVVNDSVLWVSGTNGTVGKSTDGGNHWKWMTVKDYEKRDFRDIEAFDSLSAIIIAVAAPAIILKTNDGGVTWKKVYENADTSMFLDAMDFFDNKNGVVIGDPIDGKFFLAQTKDGGATWDVVNGPEAESGEACFASSGTNIKMIDKQSYAFISGGLQSRYFTQKRTSITGLTQHISTSGANSFDTNGKKIIIVGGDFMNKESETKNCVFSSDGGKTWQSPNTAPNGYRSGITFIHKRTWITCGLTGVDITYDDGKNWKPTSDQSFHVIKKSKSGNSIFLAGANGRIGKVEM